MCWARVCLEWNILFIYQPQKTFLWSIKLTPLFLFELDGKNAEKHRQNYIFFSIKYDFIVKLHKLIDYAVYNEGIYEVIYDLWVSFLNIVVWNLWAILTEYTVYM